MATLDIKGTICPNDYEWFYEWFDMDCTSPRMVEQAIDQADGEELTVNISSPGGEIGAGSDIYTMLREYGNIKIKVTGQACSAASVIAMAGYCEMAPTALMMVHCVSTSASGNHADMEKTAETLKTADKAMCTAYMAKAGMSEEEALEMMEQETWLTANEAVKRGLVDAIMFEDEDDNAMVASANGLPSKEELEQARADKAEYDKATRLRAAKLIQKGADIDG